MVRYFDLVAKPPEAIGTARSSGRYADIGFLVVSLSLRSCVHIMAACADGRGFLRPLTEYTRVFPMGTVGLLVADGHLLGFLLFRDRNDW